MKEKTFFIVFERLSFGQKQKFDKKWWTQALTTRLKSALTGLLIFLIGLLRHYKLLPSAKW